MTYLEKKNELREALDGLHHQAVERDAVHAGRLLPLSTKRDIKRFDSRKCTGISFVCLFGWLFFFCGEISSGRKARGLPLRIEARQNSRLSRCGRASGRERERYENSGPLVICTDEGGNSSHVLCLMCCCRLL